ncbi:ABC transporter permease [Thomasclavelia sp.]|uniref:ABC transporter permease n=1 Tax=Thomasclavelia sp. TaxID=3025757 RepID=UPI00261D69AA|nr:ABC transporter permease [Thomasclavelia sp.]
MKLIKDLYEYRELLKTNVKKDIRGKYKGSFLGILWSFLNPLLMVVVYAIVFPYIMKIETENYLQYLICGVIPWNFFTTVMALGMGSIKNNAGIVNKVYFPREILPISASLSGLVNFFIACIIIILFCVFGGLGISWHIILVPFVALIQFLITTGLVLGLSAVNVYVQDTEYIVQFIINMLFYATPILYPAEVFPSAIRWVLNLNPFTQIVNAYRDLFMYHTLPSLSSIIYVLVIASICFYIGLKTFRKLEKGFAEEI